MTERSEPWALPIPFDVPEALRPSVEQALAVLANHTARVMAFPVETVEVTPAFLP